MRRAAGEAASHGGAAADAGGGAARGRDERGQRGELERFGAWVAGAAAPFAYIVDGANVGYRSQNFEGGRFSFAQVEIARLALRERAGGREPLLVLPARYVGADGAVPNHTALATGVGIGSRKRRAEANRMEPLSADDAACVARWRAAGALWEVPDAANDDWHWMYATLLGGADARVLTNDEMRDHALRCAETEGAGGGEQRRAVRLLRAGARATSCASTSPTAPRRTARRRRTSDPLLLRASAAPWLALSVGARARRRRRARVAVAGSRRRRRGGGRGRAEAAAADVVVSNQR